MLDRDVFIKRRNTLRNKIKSGLVLILGNEESPMNYPSNGYHFIQDSNFSYFFGLDHPNYIGVMDIDADTDCIYGDDLSVDDIIWMGELPSLKEMAAESGISSTASISTLSKVIDITIKQGRKIHFLPPYRAEATLTLERLLGIESINIQRYVSTPLIRAVVAMREIKSQEEIAELNKAAETGYLMHKMAMQMCKTGARHYTTTRTHKN